VSAEFRNQAFDTNTFTTARPLMSLSLKPPLAPMEARSVDAIPTGDGWQYEPKFDGFRCLAFRRERDVYLQSKSGQPLARYFPDIAAGLSLLPAK
jgi:ATP-dependent DNA ligase